MTEKTETVYFVAIRVAEPRNGAEVVEAMKALEAHGLIPDVGGPTDYAVAWSRPYSELTANDNTHLRALGLDYESANRIATVVWTEESNA